MAIKVFPFLVALLAAVLVAQTVSSEENVQPDILFIENPDTNPEIISPTRAFLDAPRNNLICTATMCRNVCGRLTSDLVAATAEEFVSVPTSRY